MNWKSLEISHLQFDIPFVISRPSLVVNIYGENEISSNVKRFFDYFFENYSNECLYVLTEKSRSFKPVKLSGINRLIDKLNSNQSRYLFIKDAPEFDVGFNSMELDLGLYPFEKTIKTVHFSFPIGLLERDGQLLFVEKFRALLNEVNPQHACAGFGFSLVFGREWEMIALPKIFAYAKRFQGLEIPHRYTEVFLNRKIKGPSWITYLSPEMASEVKDINQIESQSSGLEISLIGKGVFIRSDLLPPIGDVNRGNVDTQNLKTLAKILKPISTEKWEATNLFGEFMDEANDWFLRFDK